MPDDIILAKVEIIENCLRRIMEVYDGNPDNLRLDITRQDSIILNLERACQAAIDLALRLIKINRWGLPKESREAFEILAHHGILQDNLANQLMAMVGFRNVAVHNYRAIDLEIVESIITTKLEVFREFNSVAIKATC